METENIQHFLLTTVKLKKLIKTTDDKIKANKYKFVI